MQIRGEAINATAIRVTWEPPADEIVEIEAIHGYQVHYNKLNETDPFHWQVLNQNTSRIEAVITGLQPESAYEFTVNAFTRKGDGVRSRPEQVTTKPSGESLYTLTFGVVIYCIRYYYHYQPFNALNSKSNLDSKAHKP